MLHVIKRPVVGVPKSMSEQIFAGESDHEKNEKDAFGLLVVFAFAAYLRLRIGLRPYGLSGWASKVLFVLYCSDRRKNSTNRSRNQLMQ